MPREVRTLLFVCLGNICRSPFAAALAERRLASDGAGIRCLSAGLNTSQAARSPQEACHAAGAYGLSLDTHEPRPLTKELMQGADMVVVMEHSQLHAVRQAYPQYSDRVFLLSLFDAHGRRPYERYNIADPFGQPPAMYDDCYRRIAAAVDAIAVALAPITTRSVQSTRAEIPR